MICVSRLFRDHMPSPACMNSHAADLAARYFLIGVGIEDFPCAPPKGRAGVAGLALSFFGFFCSRLLRICPLAILGFLKL